MWSTIDRVGARLMTKAPRFGLHLRGAASKHVGEAELSLLPMLCDPAKVSIDIGANFGVYAYRLAQCSASVVAFEPNPPVATMLAQALPSVRVERCALADYEGQARLHIPRMASGGPSTGFGSLVVLPGDVLTFDVPVRRLDSFQLRDVGFIKIDVEDLELQVIAGALETIGRERPAMLVEANGEVALCALTETMANLGYSAEFLNEGRLRPRSEWRPSMRTRFGVPPFNFIFRPENV